MFETFQNESIVARLKGARTADRANSAWMWRIANCSWAWWTAVRGSPLRDAQADRLVAASSAPIFGPAVPAPAV